ncbi:MAG: hypothetical protein UZ16_OP3001002186, partial [Candidatus Hinthialibacteria bacterium OLB16]
GYLSGSRKENQKENRSFRAGEIRWALWCSWWLVLVLGGFGIWRDEILGDECLIPFVKTAL